MANGQEQYPTHQSNQTQPGNNQARQPFPTPPTAPRNHRTQRGNNRPQIGNNQRQPPARTIPGPDPAQIDLNRLRRAAQATRPYPMNSRLQPPAEIIPGLNPEHVDISQLRRAAHATRPYPLNSQLLPPAEIIPGLDPIHIDISRLRREAQATRGPSQPLAPPQNARGNTQAQPVNRPTRQGQPPRQISRGNNQQAQPERNLATQFPPKSQTPRVNDSTQLGNNRAGQFPPPRQISHGSIQTQTGVPPAPIVQENNPTQLENNKTGTLPPRAHIPQGSNQIGQSPLPAHFTEENDQAQKENYQTKKDEKKQLLPAAQITRKDRSGVKNGDEITIRETRPTDTQIFLGALHIREESNTSIWITKLSADVTYTTLLRNIRGAGRIKTAQIYPPNSQHPGHAAAKITFFTNQGARNLVILTNIGGFSIDGKVPTVVWNRNKEPEKANEGLTRVLRITGPHDVVNRKTLEWFWGKYFYWNVDKVSDIGEITDDTSVIWYYFACWKGQAEAAKELLETHFPEMVKVTMERDPCGKA